MSGETGEAQLVDLMPSSLPTEAFDYNLPEAQIAQQPTIGRGNSRLLHVRGSEPGDETGDGLDDHVFGKLPELLRSGDLLVANETRVRAARLVGRRNNGGHAEILVLHQVGADFACLVRPARRLPEGERVVIGDSLMAVIGAPVSHHPGARRVTFSGSHDISGAIERYGTMPLPPYIRSPLDDASRYQTTFAAGDPVSAAAPTAGLHFTASMHERLLQRGVEWTTLRLEIGLGTFAPIRAERIGDHVMHSERFVLPDMTADKINATHARGNRVIAVGTTAMRVLETKVDATGRVQAGEGVTQLYITPGHTFRAVDGLLTNFHQPRSSLLVLVAAFVGIARWRGSYEHALHAGYRFLSLGDCMLCWKMT